MLFLHIDRERDQGYLYKQIYSQIKQSILERKLDKHDKLPSKRELANHLRVSVNTISFAYEQLLAEGYIYAIERSGYYVENIAQFSTEETPKTDFPEDLKEHPIDKTGWLSLSHMATDERLFPFADWKKSQQLGMELHETDLAHIPHQQGPYLVRETIAKLIHLTRGVNCEPEQVVLSVGTQPLIQQIMQMQQHLHVAVEKPGYARLYQHLKQMQVPVTPVNLDEKGIDIEGLEESTANIAIVTPSHQFPTGIIMPISRRIELLNWAVKRPDRYIIEDDYDSEFKYETDQIPSLQSLDRHQRVIYFGTFSKSMLTGLRISYMVLPIPLLRKYRQHYHYLIPYNNTLNVLTLHYFIESGAYSRHVKRMNHHYEAKRQTMIKELHAHFGSTVRIENIPAGLHFVAHFKTRKSYEQIEEKAEELKLEVYTIRRFMLGQQITSDGEITLIIGFAAIEKGKIKEAIGRLGHVLNG